MPSGSRTLAVVPEETVWKPVLSSTDRHVQACTARVPTLPHVTMWQACTTHVASQPQIRTPVCQIEVREVNQVRYGVHVVTSNALVLDYAYARGSTGARSNFCVRPRRILHPILNNTVRCDY